MAELYTHRYKPDALSSRMLFSTPALAWQMPGIHRVNLTLRWGMLLIDSYCFCWEMQTSLKAIGNSEKSSVAAPA